MKIAAAALASAILLASFVDASAQSVVGSYRVEGKNFDGSPYSGTAEILATSETSCRITWKTGSSTSRGICMRNGDSFAAGYVMGDAIGLVVYKMMPTARSTGPGPSPTRSAGEETLTPIK